MVTGDWVKVAVEDEFIVAELLTRLKMKKHDDSGSSPSSSAGMKMMMSLECIRQPRSRHIMIRCSGGGNNTNNQNQNQTTINSGESNTPLSFLLEYWWRCGSGGGGGGGVSICGGDGVTRIRVNLLDNDQPQPHLLRSIKTFAELKEEESLMLKERFHLKKEEKARNNQLKRIKMQVDLQHISANQRVTTVISQEVIYSQSCNNGGIDQTLMLPMVLIGARHDVGMSVVPPATLILSNNEPKENEARQSLFDLPDLTSLWRRFWS
ncbi:hypothetical protein MKW92_018019 [Papaver armeniacum]|nr:hypothetical protein MKW92_018019 [Papaver armeniacum]